MKNSTKSTLSRVTLRVLPLSIALLASGQAFAADATGTCTSISGGGAWTTTTTWATGGTNTGCDDGTAQYVPDATDDVVIPSATAVTGGTGSLTAKTVTISAGGKFTLGANTLTVSGNFTNNATAAADVNLTSSTVTFDATATVGGTAMTTFAALTTSAALTLPAAGATVTGNLTLSAGGSIAGGKVIFSDAVHTIAVNANSTIPALDLSAITTSKTITFSGAFNNTITTLTLPSPAAVGGAAKVVVFSIPNGQTLTFTGGIPSTCVATTYTTATNVVTGVTGGNLTCTINPAAMNAPIDLNFSKTPETFASEIQVK